MPMLAACVRLLTMSESSRLGGIARSKSLSPEARSHIARKAALTRWSKGNREILSRGEIRRQVARMLEDREAQAFLFGSYARGQARPKSDVDIMVVEKTLRYPRLREIYLLRARLKIDKDVDLLVIDEENFNTWKNSPGTVQNEVYREGVRLV